MKGVPPTSVWLSLLCLLLSSPAVASQEPGLFSDQGYRIAHYRRPLPQEPPAGQRIATPALAKLIDESDPVLVDVLALSLRPESREFGLAWLPTEPRRHLPGSVWLPNVGYGRLQPCVRDWFARQLRRYSGDDPDRPLVFYCVTDCWMSWNAVKRAAALGYRNIYWYPEGSDGWEAAGLPLEPGVPVPLPGMAGAQVNATLFECPATDLSSMSESASAGQAKGLMLFFETEHCPYCRRMRSRVLADTESIDHYRERYFSVALDLDSDAPMTDIDGSLTTPRALARRLGVVRTPTLVFFDLSGEEVFRYSGLIVDPAEFRALADYVAGGYVERMGFREFLAAIHDHRPR